MLAAGTTATTVSTSSNRLNSTAGTLARTYSHDAAGNTIGYGAVTFTYNFANRMKTSTSGGLTTTYLYNALSQRVRKSSTAGTTVFVYDEAGQFVGEYDATGALIQETVWLGNVPVATLRPKAGGGVDVFYVHTDHLNTPRRVSRPVGNTIVWRWDSDPFGEAPANSDPDGDAAQFVYHLRFPGQYADQETGLHYNYFRDYDPAIGRYVESDPIGLKAGVNTYRYAGANPVSFVDPLGLTPFHVIQDLLNLLKPTQKDDCKPTEREWCEDNCKGQGKKFGGCYAIVKWKLRGMRNGQPIQSEERSVQCRCVDHCDTDERVFVPFLTPAPTPFLSPAPAVVPLFVP
jgi:RHS repeat-associated protein